mmetsp:Transcript_13684/g.22329  ORF Transcript_13684/g.22329 Transcript_13684/m.22329 type:complete len:124 (-) Transcript_13684:278-649(-)|eukprot:CAMPEP_0203762032 /NCGR_PEP_ID=MMETSP0098-20131031/15000_1 /ASSEMBLY_ACC=CAM_ASM_000208 /TAXON_ID=96639 /ORGANISM=" , Strain NY0313808BC1" /LENGTH=123 /DNA_ID=CAMNT_0050656273 /DNA_START=195 /DNA_END=566 /DNA_ORIENTATION=+
MKQKTVERLVVLKSVLEAETSYEDLLARIESFRNKSLLDALENPYDTLRILSGKDFENKDKKRKREDSKYERDIELILANCGGDRDFAVDLYVNSGQNLDKALEMCGVTGAVSKSMHEVVDLS